MLWHYSVSFNSLRKWSFFIWKWSLFLWKSTFFRLGTSFNFLIVIFNQIIRKTYSFSFSRVILFILVFQNSFILFWIIINLLLRTMLSNMFSSRPSTNASTSISLFFSRFNRPFTWSLLHSPNNRSSSFEHKSSFERCVWFVFFQSLGFLFLFLSIQEHLILFFNFLLVIWFNYFLWTLLLLLISSKCLIFQHRISAL